MPARLHDAPVQLDRDPLEGKAGTPVEGQGEKPEAQKSGPPKDEIPLQQRKKQLAWLEIELVDQDNKPIAGEIYRVTLPSGAFREGALDGSGRARLEAIDPGACKVTFPAMDGRDWKRA